MLRSLRRWPSSRQRPRDGILRAAILVGACLLPAQPTFPGTAAEETVVEGQGSARTPPPGSAQRRAILDALRSAILRIHELEVVFLVEHMKVNHGWAWVLTRPRSKDGLNNYEDIAALLREEGHGWRVLELTGGGLDEVQKRYPQAPTDIFPPP